MAKTVKARHVTKRKATFSKEEGANPEEPRVIVDFIFDDGSFFISIENISDKPAYKVSIQFDKKIFGVQGSKEISALPLFRNVEFLAPYKEIVAFLDTSAEYFARAQPTKVSAQISYQDADGTRHVTTVKHDLEIYREIGYARKQRDETVPFASDREEGR